MKLQFAAIMIFSLLPCIPLFAQSFDAQGSDLLMGVGAKNIAVAGAKSAGTNDIYAVFYNPAGLSELSSHQLAVSSQADAKLGHLNFLGFAYVNEFESLDLKMVLAFTFNPRLYMKASGEFREKDFESIFLRYTLPGLSANFDGAIDSKTDDYRIAMAISPLYNPLWSFGVSIGYVNCATTFGGVSLEDPSNFTSMSTVATTVSLGLGAKYYASDALTFGINLKNLDSKLTVKVEKIDSNGETHRDYEVDVPYDFSAGLHFVYDEDIDLAADYQQIFGSYGSYTLDFKLLRFGASIHDGALDYHLGFIAPITLQSDKIESFELPFPISPTAGIGWHNNNIDISLALYIHPVMSLNLGKPSPSLDLSASYNF
ncbi:hypothetical protein KJ877_08810 [bacterium]|nr:hypothetical protein [bacterium]MBU1990797.1 hypothetical protein [bacterium]